jgi:hypothetical protein
MAFSYQDYTGDNSTTTFSIPFTYTATSEISVTVDGVAQTGLSFPSASQVTLTSAPASGTLVQVRRTTSLTARAVDFASGSVLTEEDLDNSSIQTFHASQEAIDRANDSIAVDDDDKYDAQNKVIKNVATPTNANDATNKSYVDTGANNAATSAAAALVSQNAAAASATAAANSATAAAGSATTAASEATDSANSATASASSATASANSASAASTSESNAASSASTASTQAANSATSATNSANSATASANSATASAGSASTASTQAALATTNGAAQVALATTQANNAATSATAAANSATAAATSETNAANSAAAAAAAFDNFDDTYLGSKTSDPTVDNDGDPLTQGDLYFNSTANEMRVYDGANWIAASSAGAASLILYEYTATSGQTTFSGADDNSASLSYSVGNIQVVMNGVILDPSDYTATSGTSVVLASGAATGDLVNIYAFKSFTVADTVSASAGGTFAGAVGFGAGATVTGNVTADGLRLGDGDYAAFGDGLDLQILHNSADSFITDAGTGDMYIRGDNSLLIQQLDGTKNKAQFITGGAVNLMHNGTTRFSTSSTGVDVTGTVTADGLDVSGTSTFGTSSADTRFNFDGPNQYRAVFKSGGTVGGQIGAGGADDLRFSNAAGATVATIKNGNLGIGETAPVTPLTIATTNKLGSTFTGTTNGEGLTVTQTDYSAGNYVSLVEAAYDDSNDANPNVRIGAMFDGGGSTLAFGTSNSFGAGITNTAMSIDGSGRVTMPNQPCCFIQGASSTNHNYGSGGVIINFALSGNGAFTQGGITHNTGNGRLTVPSAGRYLCGMTFYDNDGSAGAARAGIRHNGAMRGHTHTEFNNGQSAVTVLLNMAANDYIDFQQVYGTAIYMGPHHFYGFITKLN